jgi:hypothetical protein
MLHFYFGGSRDDHHVTTMPNGRSRTGECDAPLR